MGLDSLSDMEDNSFLPDFCTKPVLILGCGNRLFGDDGFGCAVAEHLLAHYQIPDDVYVMDVGTGVRKLLFTLCLSSDVPRQIIIIDAVDKDRTPGDIFEISLDDVPTEKIDDFSLHQVPSSNLAKDLQEAGADVRVIVCQIDHIPQRVEPGLSEPVARAVPIVGAEIAKQFVSLQLSAISRQEKRETTSLSTQERVDITEMWDGRVKAES